MDLGDTLRVRKQGAWRVVGIAGQLTALINTAIIIL